MDLFGHLKAYDYGEVHFKFDKASGLKAIVAIHDSRLGPALGGCRFLPYDSDEDAVVDALRLARGMTYKAALAGLPHGGSGDPSPFTALGVRRGIEACVKFKLGRESLDGVHVAVQGVGHVGYHLCKELHAAGAKLSIADVDPLKSERAQREFKASIVPLDEIFQIECDVIAPCALGSALNDTSIPRIKAKIVAGAANNQLAQPRHGDDLHARGILYAPDYAINAGGLVNVAQEVVGYDAGKSREKTMKIYDTIWEIADRAQKVGAPTYRIADMLVEEKLAAHKRTTQAPA